MPRRVSSETTQASRFIFSLRGSEPEKEARFGFRILVMVVWLKLEKVCRLLFWQGSSK